MEFKIDVKPKSKINPNKFEISYKFENWKEFYWFS